MGRRTSYLAQNPQNVFLVKSCQGTKFRLTSEAVPSVHNLHLITDPAAEIQPRVTSKIFRPNLSDSPPMKIEERATPIRVHMGRKYVAELNPNGSLLCVSV